jgi:hypothetical protein
VSFPTNVLSFYRAVRTTRFLFVRLDLVAKVLMGADNFVVAVDKSYLKPSASYLICVTVQLVAVTARLADPSGKSRQNILVHEWY